MQGNGSASNTEQLLAKERRIQSPAINGQKDLQSALQQIFPEKKEEGRLQKARRILGSTVEGVSDEQLEVYVTEFHYLITAWLDEYERKVFDGLTLREVVQEE